MAKRPPWFLNAARRTLLTAVPALAVPDDDYAAALLSEAELGLFMRLSAPEREHAIVVARCVERRWDAAVARAGAAAAEVAGRETVLRAALLHDVGKLGASNHVLWRVLTHLLPESEAPPEPRLTGLAGTRQARRHHGAYGEQLILAAGGDPEVARLVRGHQPRTGADRALEDGVVRPAGPAHSAADHEVLATDPSGLIAACDELT